jgi:hypothetical protein
MKNVRASTLKKYTDSSNIRLSSADRDFLSDLARVRIIDEKDADSHHYQKSRSKASRRLDKLSDAGILEKREVFQTGRGKFNAYTFKNQKVAGLFGGKTALIGSKRNAFHEVVTSKLYFAKGRPDSFTIEADFTKSQKDSFRLGQGLIAGRDICLPDAIFIENGEMVAVEADSGQYTQSQIRSKQAAWAGIKQVWGQPSKAAARVHGNAEVFRF